MRVTTWLEGPALVVNLDSFYLIYGTQGSSRFCPKEAQMLVE